MRVTFDTNTLASLVSPDTAQRGTGKSGATVRAAIEDGRVQGYFSETLVTLEGIRKKDRVDDLGSSRVQVQMTSPNAKTVTATIGLTQNRRPIDPRSSARTQGAVDLGLRALRSPSRLGGGIRVKDDDRTFYKSNNSVQELIACMDKVNELATAIEARSVGRAIALSLGLKFSERDHAPPELWLQGLGRARPDEHKEVSEAVAEWADGDSVASHYGFGINLFCSEDFHEQKSGASVLDRNNRRWLSDEYGIKFVTLAELARMVTA